jgi:hypothetical protein
VQQGELESCPHLSASFPSPPLKSRPAARDTGLWGHNNLFTAINSHQAKDLDRSTEHTEGAWRAGREEGEGSTAMRERDGSGNAHEEKQGKNNQERAMKTLE